jgi:hypothetical protein
MRTGFAVQQHAPQRNMTLDDPCESPASLLLREKFPHVIEQIRRRARDLIDRTHYILGPDRADIHFEPRSVI